MLTEWMFAIGAGVCAAMGGLFFAAAVWLAPEGAFFDLAYPGAFSAVLTVLFGYTASQARRARHELLEMGQRRAPPPSSGA